MRKYELWLIVWMAIMATVNFIGAYGIQNDWFEHEGLTCVEVFPMVIAHTIIGWACNISMVWICIVTSRKSELTFNHTFHNHIYPNER